MSAFDATPDTINWPCQCGGQMSVKDSRPTTFYGAHAIRRRRRCVRCQTKVATIEIVRNNPLIETLDRAQSLIGRAAALSASLTELAHSLGDAIKPPAPPSDGREA